jgi:hypothetical protein
MNTLHHDGLSLLLTVGYLMTLHVLNIRFIVVDARKGHREKPLQSVPRSNT